MYKESNEREADMALLRMVVLCDELVHETGHVVVSVEYRLSPEAQFPKPLDDCFDALMWVGRLSFYTPK